MTYDVFISYSTKDKPIADAICANLETVGVRCWIAPVGYRPGGRLADAVTRAISISRIMVLVFSANSNSSEDVSRELFLAANSKLVIIPFKIENIEPEPGKQYYLARNRLAGCDQSAHQGTDPRADRLRDGTHPGQGGSCGGWSSVSPSTYCRSSSLKARSH